MRRWLLTSVVTLAWLLASPSLHLPESRWIEVGVAPAAAQDTQQPAQNAQPAQEEQQPAKPAKKQSKKAAQKPAKRVGSSGLVTSNQPGFYPMQPITPPKMPDVTGTVITPARDPRYPNVPTVPIIPRGTTGGAGVETSQDRIIRCTHQGTLGGLSPGQQGVYVHNCAF